MHCPFSSKISSKAHSVALLPAKCVTGKSVVVTNHLLLNLCRKTKIDASVEISACVPPINNQYKNVDELLEFIEVHRTLGMGSFHFYNYSMMPLASRVLQWYHLFGIVKVVSWDMPAGLLDP